MNGTPRYATYAHRSAAARSVDRTRNEKARRYTATATDPARSERLIRRPRSRATTQTPTARDAPATSAMARL